MEVQTYPKPGDEDFYFPQWLGLVDSYLSIQDRLFLHLQRVRRGWTSVAHRAGVYFVLSEIAAQSICRSLIVKRGVAGNALETGCLSAFAG